MASHGHQKNVVPLAARMVTKTPRREHITPILKQLDWRSIEDTIKYRDVTLAHHAIHSPHAPVSVVSLFRSRSEVTERRTRAKRGALELPPVRTTFARRSLRYRAAAEWNRLPECVTSTAKRTIFKSKIPF